jgi:hypothetical protein
LPELFGTITRDVGCYRLHATRNSAGDRARRRMESLLKATPDNTQMRAEAAFKKKQMQLVEGPKAMAEYNAKRLALRDKTARLRALRLARDAAAASAATETGRAQS